MGGVLFHLVPRLLGQSMELVQAKHMVEAEALLFAPGTTTTSFFGVLNCSISTNRHHVCQCCHHDDHHSFTMDTMYLSASAKVGVTSITLNLSHFSSLPSWQRQCFCAFPSLSQVTREKKIPEELCLSPPTALAHQSQSLSEDKIDLKFHVCNCAINRLHD